MAAGRDVSPGNQLDTIQALVFTFVLLASSPTFQFGVWAQERGQYKKARNWIITSFLLGAAFLGNQMYEWKTLPFRPRTNAYGSLFYIMSGLHGLHVLLGPRGDDRPPRAARWLDQGRRPR